MDQIVKVGNANAYLINSGAFWQSYETANTLAFTLKSLL